MICDTSAWFIISYLRLSGLSQEATPPLMSLEKSPNWLAVYADNLSLHVSSRGITSVLSIPTNNSGKVVSAIHFKFKFIVTLEHINQTFFNCSYNDINNDINDINRTDLVDLLIELCSWAHIYARRTAARSSLGTPVRRWYIGYLQSVFIR